MIAIVVVIDEKNGIGKNGGLLCHLPNDLKHFKKITTGHTIIMGRKTYESLPNGSLPDRINIVVTSGDVNNFPGCIVVRSIEEALSVSKSHEKVFIIGGGELYRTTFHLADTLYLTRIHNTFNDADTFFPNIDFKDWELIEEERHMADDKHLYPYTFLTYYRKKVK
ncbi:MAG TPA: dihydrofolate reductase [Fermentimonas caenicola]|jgi:dihydrofolate reductase|uniref:Dihydrofolate reductase n=1 Tax=Fermentimonas caenicola TaxID=1562970 RepID=A0A098BZ58_9BACT|nr:MULTISPECIES: dihydrofolate reductase [Lascolabacillus]MBP6176240.1 dihydrofolate reductase [Fermentimonas sp.]MDI9626350.1 dihydrofolate reductase [Bacteroidota bacterium]TAH61940.1 MAG: dihydrofolate reductase [Fermentimonas caenicola]MBP6196269.1 dihydrofolate reductase [Fermentimonas sp.]MBP7105143.1 dihydrofolate reductase [Fermentimonas sp.]